MAVAEARYLDQDSDRRGVLGYPLSNCGGSIRRKRKVFKKE